MPNTPITPGTQVSFQQFHRVVKISTPDGRYISVGIEYEVLYGTVVSDDGETADVLVDDFSHKQKHYHLKHHELTFESAPPPSSISFDDLLQGR